MDSTKITYRPNDLPDGRFAAALFLGQRFIFFHTRLAAVRRSISATTPQHRHDSSTAAQDGPPVTSLCQGGVGEPASHDGDTVDRRR